MEWSFWILLYQFEQVSSESRCKLIDVLSSGGISVIENLETGIFEWRVKRFHRSIGSEQTMNDKYSLL